MSFKSDLHDGFQRQPRGDQINTWGREAELLAGRCDAIRGQMTLDVENVVHEIFYEIGRLCRDAGQ